MIPHEQSKTVWDAHLALRRMGLNDFDYVTLSWLLGYSSQGYAALLEQMTEQDYRTCEQLCGPNGYMICKMLEAKRGQG
jgi:hypothetical protein